MIVQKFIRSWINGNYLGINELRAIKVRISNIIFTSGVVAVSLVHTFYVSKFNVNSKRIYVKSRTYLGIVCVIINLQ